MGTFATEFPVTPALDRKAFIEELILWLRGNQNSTIFDGQPDLDADSDSAHLKAASGEEVRVRQLSSNGLLLAIGFRHDLPDEFGRIWRTEAVVRRGILDGSHGVLRLRTQCIARKSEVKLEEPRKPYFVKRLLNENFGGVDGVLNTTDKPIWLEDNDNSALLVSEISLGRTFGFLPVIYISTYKQSDWLLTKDQIEKMAYDMGGIAHVVVEPNRAFSFKVRDLSNGTNAYGGVLGIAAPKRGIVRRISVGWQLPSVVDVMGAAKVFCTQLRTHMPADGWDWTELQEHILREQRARERNRLSSDQIEQIYVEEIENLKERIVELETRNSQVASSDLNLRIKPVDFNDLLRQQLGEEVYLNEFSDRLRFSAELSVQDAARIGLDPRSVAVLQAFVKKLPVSKEVEELREELKKAARDQGRSTESFGKVLRRHGYQDKSDNKHVKLEAKAGFTGLGPITLPKTPSDHRGAENMRKDIERVLGISKLGK